MTQMTREQMMDGCQLAFMAFQEFHGTLPMQERMIFQLAFMSGARFGADEARRIALEEIEKTQ